ncbi:oxygenase MpaB family protein [Actinomadura scrupuli]|uniref:oxygenase MpaB family protein n=1 Tax=Actinomadura scrupuli TaxID=559629 RepID=UPI003D97BFB0
MTDELFRDGDLIRTVGREGILLAAGGVASLLQTSHPQVGQGVHDHSYTFDDPLARLRNTMGWVYLVQFGTREEAEQLSAMIRKMHDQVRGPGYNANEPELQVWVAATLFAVAVQVYEYLFRRPFTPAELEEFYQQSKVYATILGCPEEEMPATYPDFRRYYAHMVTTLRINDASRAIAQGVLWPTGLPKILAPGLMAIRLITAGFMPEPLRAQYGWKWNAARERRFRLLMNGLAVVYPRMPLPVRTLPRTFYLTATRRMLAKRNKSRPRTPAPTSA